MDLTLTTLILLPVGLGLLGFVEPCTIGSHMVFLSTQEQRRTDERAMALLAFVSTRVLVSGLFGAAIVFAGQRLIGVQTGLWLVFGTAYLAIGLTFLLGRAGWLKHRIALSPTAWRRARNPALLGLAFGLNIPACAAPIVFALLGVAVSSGSVLSGFAMMALFGLALSAPLIPMAIHLGLASFMSRLAGWMAARPWIIGGVFVLLGLWSIWFGLFVDLADWSGQ